MNPNHIFVPTVDGGAVLASKMVGRVMPIPGSDDYGEDRRLKSVILHGARGYDVVMYSIATVEELGLALMAGRCKVFVEPNPRAESGF